VVQKAATEFMAIILSNVNRFENSFTGSFLAYVATLHYGHYLVKH